MIFDQPVALTRQKVLDLLNPSVKQWYSKFDSITEPQKYGIKLVHERQNCLISSPTGSGKTLTAFLSILNELHSKAMKNELEDRVYAIYISPLRALASDVRKNLIEPLEEIKKIDISSKHLYQEIRVAIRTGDTSQAERAKMLKTPPHILITTPESIAILLCSPKFVELFKGLDYVIVDEIHELCSNKRGVHLSLSLERLEELSGTSFTRVGLSATVAPLNKVAEFLVGSNRDCTVVDAKYSKSLDISVSTPFKSVLEDDYDSLNKSLYSYVAEKIKKNRTTLIFTNTRSGTERVVHYLKGIFKDEIENIAAHHSSLSREERFEVEDKLKRGLLKCVVSSTSLELGIDIGYIDEVIQLGSPKSVARCLQRTGRSGHRLHETSISELIPLDRDDLVEVSVMTGQALKGVLDEVQIPELCLDVLAQHVIGMAVQRNWNKNEMLALIKKSYSYKNLSEKDFIETINFLSGKFTALEYYRVYGRIWYDETTQLIGKKGKLAQMIYVMNVGVIPDSVSVGVFDKSGKHIGSIEEEFLNSLRKGDRFVLGGNVYEFDYARGMKATVTESSDKKPTVPSWFSEQLPLSWELALEISRFRKKSFDLLKEKKEKELLLLLKNELHCDVRASNSIIEYVQMQAKFLAMLKARGFHSENNLIVEKINLQEEEKIDYVFHFLYGRRVNEVISKSLAYLLTEQSGKSIGIVLSDNGFILSIPRSAKVDLMKAFYQLNEKNLRSIAVKAVASSESLKRKFRHVATRSFMILKSYMGRKKSVGRQQLSAQILLGVLKKMGDFPVLKETYREVLEDSMDVKHAEEVVKKISRGDIKVEFLPSFDLPSPFAHGLVTQGLNDAILIKDRRKILKELHERVLRTLKS